MSSEASPRRLGVYFLDVGQGDCTFLVPPRDEGDPILFDCADPYVAERFVVNHRIDTLEAVIASHLDADHIKGLLPFLRNHFEAGRRVRQLIIGLDRAPNRGADRGLTALLDQASRWGEAPPHEGFGLYPPFREGRDPRRVAAGNGWTVELVLPWYDTTMKAAVHRRRDPNTSSVVLRIEYGGTSVLITGDAPLGSLRRAEPRVLRTHVLRVPHHGGDIRHGGETWEEVGELYRGEVAPRFGLISVGSANPYEHPTTNHVDQLLTTGCRVMCTQLTPRCHANPAHLRDVALDQAAGVEWPYRHRIRRGDPGRRLPPNEVPCAGSIAAWIDERGDLEVEPATADHEVVVDRVDSALCRTDTQAGPGTIPST